jgi:flagellar hook-basal body complex protein FliE
MLPDVQYSRTDGSMQIQPIGATSASAATSGLTAAQPDGGLGQAFTNLLDRLSQTEQDTNALVARAATGDDVDLHDVMIATQAESLAFQVGLQVRNKLVEAYQEIFRMQV